MTSELSLRQRKKLAARSASSHAAWSLMADRGLDAATPEAVAEAANGSPRTFRNYFGSREKAILHGLVSRVTTLVDTMRARPAEEPVGDSLVKVLPAFTATFAVQRDDIAVFMRAVAENPAMRAQYFVAYEDAHQRLAEFIADRTGTDVERDLAPRLLAATAAAVLRTSVEIGAEAKPAPHCRTWSARAWHNCVTASRSVRGKRPPTGPAFARRVSGRFRTRPTRRPPDDIVPPRRVA
ncbi:TetR/AcrR family transcriptional regulator [Streptomyces hawaiiensis]|uniref:TetR/AcrR family transcriptional regulator n=1 Tax=Streptomyces hawaiiensis TaxID=67305 RepID=UPI003650E1B9